MYDYKYRPKRHLDRAAICVTFDAWPCSTCPSRSLVSSCSVVLFRPIVGQTCLPEHCKNTVNCQWNRASLKLHVKNNLHLHGETWLRRRDTHTYLLTYLLPIKRIYHIDMTSPFSLISTLLSRYFGEIFARACVYIYIYINFVKHRLEKSYRWHRTILSLYLARGSTSRNFWFLSVISGKSLPCKLKMYPTILLVPNNNEYYPLLRPSTSYKYIYVNG